MLWIYDFTQTHSQDGIEGQYLGGVKLVWNQYVPFIRKIAKQPQR